MSEEMKNKPVTDEVAVVTKDIDIFAGYLGRLENPDPTLRSEARGKGLKLYDEVDRDAQAGSVLQTRYLSIAGLEWKVTPGDESAKAQEIADFVMEAVDGCNFTQAIQELMQAVLYGFFVSEIIWGVRADGKWVPTKLIGKHPRRFSFTTERELRLLTPQNMIDGEPVPDRKFITFSYGSSDNPYGKGLGQKLWWPVWFKKNGIKFWLIFLDKFGSPTPKGTYPAGATTEQKNTLLDAIEAIHQETGIIVPEGMAIELLEAARGGNISYETMCEYMDRQMSKAVLGQTATTEGTPGKLGNDDAQQDVRRDILVADSDLLGECLNDTIVRWLVDLNFADAGLYPWLELHTDEQEDLKARAEVDKIIVGDMGLPVGVDYFYETYGYPKPDQGATLLHVLQASAPAFSEGMTIKKFTPEQQAIENLADKAISQVDLGANEEKILQAVQAASSFEEAIENLLELYPSLDMTGLEQIISRADVSAGLYGMKVVRDAGAH